MLRERESVLLLVAAFSFVHVNEMPPARIHLSLVSEVSEKKFHHM
jgi:hypothetical protein